LRPCKLFEIGGARARYVQIGRRLAAQSSGLRGLSHKVTYRLLPFIW
jgi:hypothetical protein